MLLLAEELLIGIVNQIGEPMKHIFLPSLIATAGLTSLLLAANSSTAADNAACTAGIGRYQIATAIYNEFKTTIYETVIDTCTGEVVRREKVGSGEYE